MVTGLFRTMDADEVDARIEKHWDFSRGFPEPKFTIRCPQCGSDDIILRSYRFHKRPNKSRPFRCDVGVKCTQCSMAFVFGVVVSKELYARRRARRYERSEVERILTNGQ